MLSITEMKAEFKEIYGRDPTRAEITAYLLGYIRIVDSGYSAPLVPGSLKAEAAAPPPSILVYCPHCGKQTPKDAVSCIHCHHKVK